jgi:hypothetical protein
MSDLDIFTIDTLSNVQEVKEDKKSANVLSKKSGKIKETYTKVKDLIEKYKKENNVERYVFKLSSETIGSEQVHIITMVPSIATKLSKLKNLVKYAGMAFAVCGIIYSVYQIFSAEKDEVSQKLEQIDKKLDTVLDEIKNSTQKITDTIQEESLKIQLSIIENNILSDLCKLHTYSTRQFKTECETIPDINDCYRKLNLALENIELVLNHLDISNVNSHICRYLDKLDEQQTKNNNILNILLDIDVFYKNTIQYCDSILQKIVTISTNRIHDLTDEKYETIMIYIYGSLERIMELKLWDVSKNSTFMKIHKACMETIYNEYKCSRIKIGDMISFQSLKNNHFLSVDNRDFLYFSRPESGVWESFKAVNSEFPTGEMVKYGSTFNLQSHKTDQYIGYYTADDVKREKIGKKKYKYTKIGIRPCRFNAATHHYNMTGLERIIGLSFEKDKSDSDYIQSGDIVFVLIKTCIYNRYLDHNNSEYCYFTNVELSCKKVPLRIIKK